MNIDWIIIREKAYCIVLCLYVKCGFGEVSLSVVLSQRGK